MNNKYILYGVGRQGMLALQKYSKERIAYFCDGFSDKTEIDGIPVIRPEKLPEIASAGDYTVVITPKIEKVRDDIAKTLDELKISYLIFEKTDSGAYGTKTFRICGHADKLNYIIDENETKGYNWRVEPTVALFRAMFSRYKDVFVGKQIDMTVFVGDHVLDGYEQLMSQKLDRIFAYSTIHVYSDQVIPIPDYRVCFEERVYPFEETPTRCREAGLAPWQDKRIGWRGTIASSDERKWLKRLADQHPDKLYVDDPAWEENKVYIPMTDLAKFKYTLDIRGYGWTDRVKILLQLHRPLFLVDRPYREWYFDDLVPMKHFVPVKEDMSDLIKKYELLESDPALYEQIVRSANEFVKDHFSPDAVMECLKDMVLKYGVCG